jgi:hypothetical protein
MEHHDFRVDGSRHRKACLFNQGANVGGHSLRIRGAPLFGLRWPPRSCCCSAVVPFTSPTRTDRRSRKSGLAPAGYGYSENLCPSQSREDRATKPATNSYKNQSKTTSIQTHRWPVSVRVLRNLRQHASRSSTAGCRDSAILTL